MKNLYYDGKLSKEINDIYQNNVVLSEKMYRDYIELYKSDYSMKVQYAKNLIALGKFEKAETLLNMVEREYLSDDNYMNSKKDMNIFLESLLMAKIKLYIYTKRYEEAYELIKQNPEAMRHLIRSNLTVKFYLEKKLGLEYSDDILEHYQCSQIIDYDYDKFLEHVMRSHGEKTHSEGVSYFDSTFPYEEVMEELKMIIPNNKRIYNGLIDNHYYIKYNQCGYDNDCVTDYFSLVTFDDSKEFITMYPIQEKEKYPYIDLNYLKRDELPPHKRVRRMSQMEKFNQKYKNMI